MSHHADAAVSSLKQLMKEPYWRDIVSAFPLLYASDCGYPVPKMCSRLEFIKVKNLIIEKNITSLITERVMSQIMCNLSFANTFWLYFLNEETIDSNILRNPLVFLSSDLSCFEKFQTAVNEFFSLSQTYIQTINRLQTLNDDRKNLMNNFYNRINGVFRSQLTDNYNKIIYHFYRTALRILIMKSNISIEITSEQIIEQCSGCSFEVNHCNCEHLLQLFHTTNWQLNTIGILELLSYDIVVDLITSVIETEINKKTSGNYEERVIPLLENWIDNIVFDWIRKIFGQHSADLDPFFKKLKRNLYNLYAKKRIYQLYEINIRYPDSKPVVTDLTSTLQKIDTISDLREILEKSLRSKMLQPEMSTVDVLQIYTTTIKIFRKIDPSGYLLTEVTQLIKSIFGKRKDSIRKIIDYLISNISKTFEIVYGEISYNNSEVAQDFRPFSKDKYYDVATLLIDICDSRENFINEVRLLMAERIFQIASTTEISCEMTLLRILRSRIGESDKSKALRLYEIMILDVQISIETNTSYESHVCIDSNPLQFTVEAIIYSEHYWPKLEYNFSINLPPVIQTHLEYYKKYYEDLKDGRTVIWNPNVGQINMDVILNGKVTNMTVSFIQACVIWQFQDQVEWTLDDLSIKTNIPTCTLKIHLQFWMNKGILSKKSSDTYILVDNSAEDGQEMSDTSNNGQGVNNSSDNVQEEYNFSDNVQEVIYSSQGGQEMSNSSQDAQEVDNTAQNDLELDESLRLYAYYYY